MVKATDITICTEESCDFLPCLIARRDVAAEELRAAASWDQPSAFRKYVDCARAVRRGEEEEARFHGYCITGGDGNLRDSLLERCYTTVESAKGDP